MRCAVLILCLCCLWSPLAVQASGPELGTFEGEVLREALETTGRSIHVAPEGCTVGQIIVQPGDVFSSRDGFLQWFNLFHRTSQGDVIEREVLLRPGMTWNAELVAESMRRLQDRVLLNVAVIVPLRTDDPTVVDLLVATRDVWSLRLNTDFKVQQDTLSYLTFQLAENNFLGWRKKLGANFAMTQGAFTTGHVYSDPNILGSRWTLQSSSSFLFGRESGEFEGTGSLTRIAYPLWALATEWGGSLEVEHYDAPIRLYQGATLAPFTFEDEEGAYTVPWEYHQRELEVTARFTYSHGHTVKQRWTLGYEYDREVRESRENFSGTDALRTAFDSELDRLSETQSAVFLTYRLFTPEYVVLRNIGTYELAENVRLGPDFRYTLSRGMRTLGGDNDYTGVSTRMEYGWQPWDDSYLGVAASWSARLQGGEALDQRVSSSLYVAFPAFAGFRFVTRTAVDVRLNPYYAFPFFLGSSDQGLRGHGARSLRGYRRIRTNIELRTPPVSWGFLRIGGVCFYDMGDAVDSFDALHLKHDLGVGLRVLIPQVNWYVLRVDVGFPTQPSTAESALHVSAGFQQVF